MRDRYSIGVGLVFLAFVVFVAIRMLGGGNEEATLGLDQLEARWPLPEFAVPAAAGPLEGDANVAQDDCGSGGIPCPEQPPRKPACAITVRGALRVCDFFDKPLVISFWFTGGGGCIEQQDVVERVYQRYRGRVNFLSLDVRDDRGTVREIVAQHGWRMPVGYDRDGAVASLYGVALCPTIAYAYPGGTLQSASIGDLTGAQLEARVRRLLAATRAAEALPAAAATSSAS
ncbi:MAG: TlpA family protein disulfide reductase [Actinobacteria bacterium]|nr:TlpA family protein disulfide reductase [Actinomycetota bacterium]